MELLITIIGVVSVLVAAAAAIARRHDRKLLARLRATRGPLLPPPELRIDFRGQRALVGKGWHPKDERIARGRPKFLDRRPQFDLPRIQSPDELWQFLGLHSFRELVHLADANTVVDDPMRTHRRVHRLPTGEAVAVDRRHAKLANYTIARIPKRGGGTRVIQAPKPRLKAAQRRILHEILDKVPPHPAATAFRRGHDVRENAQAHVGRRIVAAWDIRDFFPSIKIYRVASLFQWLGYPPNVAHCLALLTTYAMTGDEKLPNKSRALPQGAPTSPAIANLVCYRLDCRLSGAAKRFGAAYTRYADDIAFSGDDSLLRGLPRFIPLVEKILRDEEFRSHQQKRRFMRHGARQRVTGLVVNERVAVPREEFDRLKAILHNAACAHSLESQNREGHSDFAAHIAGRIAWIERFHLARGAKLREMLRSVDPRPEHRAGGGALPAAPPPD